MSGVPPADDLAGAGFRTFTRAEWAALRGGLERGTSDQAAAERRGGPIRSSADEQEAVFEPLCQVLANAVADRSDRPGQGGVGRSPRGAPAPFVVGVTGSVAVGKSTVAGQLRSALERHPARQPVDVLSTDSFLFPNEQLAARGLMARKGFPDTYDRPRLVAALTAIRAGAPEVEVPVYSHRDYDIVPGRCQVITRPTTLIVEGLDVLQAGPGEEGATSPGPSVSDFLDWSIYVDAVEVDIARWHCERLLDIHRAGDPEAPGFLGWFCSLGEDEAAAIAEQSWWGINSVNLREHIAPTRDRASVILHKGPDHRVTHVRVRTG